MRSVVGINQVGPQRRRGMTTILTAPNREIVSVAVRGHRHIHATGRLVSRCGSLALPALTELGPASAERPPSSARLVTRQAIADAKALDASEAALARRIHSRANRCHDRETLSPFHVATVYRVLAGSLRTD